LAIPLFYRKEKPMGEKGIQGMLILLVVVVVGVIAAGWLQKKITV